MNEQPMTGVEYLKAYALFVLAVAMLLSALMVAGGLLEWATGIVLVRFTREGFALTVLCYPLAMLAVMRFVDMSGMDGEA